MTPSDWRRRLQEQLQARQRQHLFRTRQAIIPLSATTVRYQDRTLVNFASNDYLGLTHHPRMIDALTAAARSHGVGSGASALITGHSDLHAQAEQKLAQWKSVEAAVLLPSGYQANLAAVQTLAAMGEAYPGKVRFLLDKLVHASLVDAVRLSDCPFRVFPHNHMTKLARLLEQSPAEQLQVVVSESIFSMDGDSADLRGLAELKKRFGFILLLDEAHASGVFGPDGAGLAAELDLRDSVDVYVVTLGKALGCAGGAVCASQAFCDALVNFGRAHIYTTQLPACIAAAVTSAIDCLKEEPDRQARLRQKTARVRRELSSRFQIPPGESPIIPIILGDEARAIEAAQQLLGAGFWVPAVRPPTVPRASSRLRLTLCSEHTDEQIAQLIAQILLLQ